MATKLKVCAYTILLFLCFTAYANGFGTISGKVKNGFGIPIDGVDVQVKGTDFNTTTDNDGNYKINYRPGITEMSFTKRGYTRSVVSVNTSEITDIDFKLVTLWKYPISGGMYLIMEKEYVLINENSFFAQKDETGMKFIVKGEPTIVNKKEVVVLDYEQHNPLVVGKNLYVVYDGNLLGSLGASEYPIKLIDDKYVKIANNIGLRISTLEPGKYFYYTGYMNNRTRKGKGVFFEVKP